MVDGFEYIEAFPEATLYKDWPDPSSGIDSSGGSAVFDLGRNRLAMPAVMTLE